MRRVRRERRTDPTGGGRRRSLRRYAYYGRAALLGVGLSGKAGDFSRCGLFVQHTLFGRLVDGGLGRLKRIDNIPRFLGDGEAHIFDDIFYPGLNRFVPQAPALVLAGTFQC